MYKVRKPKKEGDYYVWQESYADGPDAEYTIQTFIYQRMNNYVKEDGSKLFKYYYSEREALHDYVKAAKSLLEDVISGRRQKGYGMVYARLLADMLYTMENS